MPRHPQDRRSTRAWRTLAARVVREEPVCWLALPGCTVRSTTADHVIPVSADPSLCMIRANLRGACWSCNQKRGNRPVDELASDREPPGALDFFG